MCSPSRIVSRRRLRTRRSPLTTVASSSSRMGSLDKLKKGLPRCVARRFRTAKHTRRPIVNVCHETAYHCRTLYSLTNRRGESMRPKIALGASRLPAAGVSRGSAGRAGRAAASAASCASGRGRPRCAARRRRPAARAGPRPGDLSGPATPTGRSRDDQARQRLLWRLLPGLSRQRPARRGSRWTEPAAVAARAERPGRRAHHAGRPAGTAESGHARHAAAEHSTRRHQGDRDLHP